MVRLGRRGRSPPRGGAIRLGFRLGLEGFGAHSWELTGSASRTPADPDPTRLHDDESSNKPFPTLPHELQHRLGKILARPCRKAKEEDPFGRPAARVDQLAEVFVFRQDDPSLTDRKVHHPFVLCPRREFRNGDNVMTSRAQGADHGEVATLVGQESHQASRRVSPEGLMMTVSSCARVSAA